MKAAFLSLGCKVNYYETEKMKESFKEKGISIVGFDEPADIYVINTCSVTNIADRKSRKMIHKARRMSPDAMVVATGCYVAPYKLEEVHAQGADVCIPNENKDNLLELVLDEIKNRGWEIDAENVSNNKKTYEDKLKNRVETGEYNIPVDDEKNNYKDSVDDEEKNNYKDSVDNKEKNNPKNNVINENISGNVTDNDSDSEHDHTRAFIKIQDGCNQFCTYCIIPYMRGKLKSRPEQNVINEVKKLARDGYKEIVITGIHVSSYGVDMNYQGLKQDGDEKISANEFLRLDGKPLLSLIRKISEIDGMERIRLGSLEPRIITETFAKELSEIPKVCPHFHLSLQSGCDSVLQRMNRHYTTEDYKNGVNILRKYFDNPAITTDIIVGFVGETEEEFVTTCEFANEIKFADIHVFKYSRRSNTVADRMPGQVDENIKNERSHRLIEIKNNLKKEYDSKIIGQTVKVLLEEKCSDHEMTGYTERYVKICVDKAEDDSLQNQIVNVAVTGENYGEIVREQL
ncbi:MAG: tRNA (N(6)-L-threonylcarbamoyladenosine(37)-C(2))-methylthiotransferase MtaB [Lachnospiraceae bacterium]|nr:tRNA (N(6)-L-threonylcarbamoyladenosine(37)-C(2))-methylthiotransferase MtaB [Lachnospiraceae bacterium]